ncbi:MAG: hypothetical protein ACM3UR_09345 [Bacteroidota bacterium]|nr:hypothetical protein [Ignavibacteria bacterium]MCU7499233.1 hypothetical protein [Ignavibacteria bacterium]MCU7520329.1 hypothetical protein [Ignavibacteria bacterium]MCU7523932.1 hypothetical protein [Ignavibacteria bacterium]
MSTELIMITAFVIVTFLVLQIVKIRKPQPASNEEDLSIIAPGECDLVEVSEFDENATLK